MALEIVERNILHMYFDSGYVDYDLRDMDIVQPNNAPSRYTESNVMDKEKKTSF